MTPTFDLTTDPEKDRLLLTHWKKRKLRFSLLVETEELTRKGDNGAVPGFSAPAWVTA